MDRFTPPHSTRGSPTTPSSQPCSGRLTLVRLGPGSHSGNTVKAVIIAMKPATYQHNHPNRRPLPSLKDDLLT